MVKCLSEEALQIAEKRREVKGEGKEERYTHLNAKFQRTARREESLPSDRCKEIAVNNTMGKARGKLEIPRDHFILLSQRWAQ